MHMYVNTLLLNFESNLHVALCPVRITYIYIIVIKSSEILHCIKKKVDSNNPW